jgi:multiple sugar transport system substrate-binding protein
MNTFTPGARQMATLNGTVYGLPEFTDDRTLMVNESVIHKAGLADADISTTNWSKLSQLARKLTSTSNGKLQTIGFDPKLPEFFPVWAAANGGAILSSNGLTAELNSPQNVAALNYAVSLIRAQGGYSNFITYRNTWNYFGNNNPFAEGQIGITPFENWMFNVVASTSPDVTVHAVPFTDRKGNVIDYETGSVWVIPKAAKNPQAACVFAKTMTEASTWMAAAQNRIKLYKKQGYYFSGLLTGNHVADRNILLYAEKNASTNNPWDQAMLVTYAVEAHSFTVPNSPASEAVQNDWTQAVNSVLQGQASAKAALDQAQSQAQASINSAKGSA